MTDVVSVPNRKQNWKLLTLHSHPLRLREQVGTGVLMGRGQGHEGLTSNLSDCRGKQERKLFYAHINVFAMTAGRETRAGTSELYYIR
jgi:hypothetical protein